VAPAAAAAEEGPGYGGTAASVTVQWQAAAGNAEGVAVYASGFHGGSAVQLRVGAAADRTVYADEFGALRILVVSAADLAEAGPAAGTTVLPVDAGGLATGVSVQATGRDPAGGIRTIVGTVPPRTTHNGALDVAPWVALAALAASALLTHRARLRPLRRAAVREQDVEWQSA
jgi:hypothetical protein